SGATEHRPRRLLFAALALTLIVEFVTAAALLTRPAGGSSPMAAQAHTMRLVDRGGPPALAERIAAEMPGAVDAVTAFWGDDWPREIVVVTTVSDAYFVAQVSGSTRNWSGIAAVAVADRVDLNRHEAFGQRIVFAPGANAMSDTALRIVLRHELFHYAARARTALGAPRWLTEGTADYVARPAAPRPGPAAVPAQLPTDAELDGPQASVAYDRAWWFARFVADWYGANGLRRLYLASGDAQSALGVGLGDLLSGWQHWLAG